MSEHLRDVDVQFKFNFVHSVQCIKINYVIETKLIRVCWSTVNIVHNILVDKVSYM
jgi:hypothetical protein